MRLVKIGGQYVNPDRVAFINIYSARQTNVWFSAKDGDRTVVRGTTDEIAALLSAEPPPVVYVCRECLEAVDVEAGRCAECDAEVVAVSGHESAATLLRWLGEARTEKPATDDEIPFGRGES